MCVGWRNDWAESKLDQIAYKVCQASMVAQDDGTWVKVFESQYIPEGRMVQREFPGERIKETGSFRRYRIGETMTDDEHHGFYMYMNIDHARWDRAPGFTILKIRIPAGTMIRKGVASFSRHPTINARKVEVLEEIV